MPSRSGPDGADVARRSAGGPGPRGPAGLRRRRPAGRLLGLSQPPGGRGSGPADRRPASARLTTGGGRSPTSATASTRPATARSWATVMALTMAAADDEPWLITHTPSTPSSMAPPVLSGSRLAASGSRWGVEERRRPRSARPAQDLGQGPGSRNRMRALQRLEGHVAGEAVGDETSAASSRSPGPRRCRRSRGRPRTAGQLGVGLLHQRGSLATPPRRSRAGDPRTLHAVALGGETAPIWANCTSIGGRALGVGPGVEQHGRRSAGWGWGWRWPAG